MIIGLNEVNRPVAMSYAVADISLPLDSVSQICDSGASVLFTKTGGQITGADGAVLGVMRRTGDTYTRRIWVPRNERTAKPEGPFQKSTVSSIFLLVIGNI